MEKKAYKLAILATILSISTAILIAPSRSFAQEKIQQPPSFYDTNTTSLEMKATLNKLGDFATSMNAYSLMLLKNPNVNFGEGQLMEHENLLKSIKRDQAYARQNAVKWEQILKPMLLGVNQNIINYDLKFNNYYGILINALNRNDKSVLTEGIINLQNSIKHNREQASYLREQLKIFREMISQDSRTFSGNISILSSILNKQMEGIPEDQNKIQSLMQQISHSNKMWNTGIVIVGVPVIGWIAGGILLAMSNKKSKNIDFLLQELQERVDSRIILSRIVGIVKGTLQNMLEAVNGAIDALGEMTAHWDSIDAQYTGLLEHIDDATNASVNFILPELNASKDSWSDIRKQAEYLNGVIRELNNEALSAEILGSQQNEYEYISREIVSGTLSLNIFQSEQ